MSIQSAIADTTTFLTDVRTELKKVTWPDWAQLRQATWLVIVFVLFIGLIIFAMDWVMQGLLVRLIPSLFGG